MLRPPAIVRYEQLYLAAFVLGLLYAALDWGRQQAVFVSNPMLAQVPWALPLLTLFAVAIRLLLWYFTARSPSVVAKWVVVAFAAFAAIGVLFGLIGLATGATPLVIGLLSLVGSALYVSAAALLFSPDARAWFGEMTDDGEGAA